VISPTCELPEQRLRAKSAAEHWVIALVLPKIPCGASKVTFLAASGAPGEARVKLVSRSG
jgi:hypothetical protein